MIVDDAHGFVFVHIPKCAGSTVRAHLAPGSWARGRTGVWLEEHPELGTVDLAHLPLYTLKAYAPDAYRKVADYDAFALVRSPEKRFPSSFAQWSRQYGGHPLDSLSARQVAEAVEHILERLDREGGTRRLLPYRYVFFQPQVDYIFDGQRRWVDNVFDVARVEALVRELQERQGTLPTSWQARALEAKNATRSYRNEAVRRSTELVRPLARPGPPRLGEATDQMGAPASDVRFAGSSIRSNPACPRRPIVPGALLRGRPRAFRARAVRAPAGSSPRGRALLGDSRRLDPPLSRQLVARVPSIVTDSSSRGTRP